MENKRTFLIAFLIALIVITAALFVGIDKDTTSSKKEHLYIPQEEPEKDELNKVTIEGSSLEDIREPEELVWPEGFAVTGPSAITIESIITDKDLTRITFESSLVETKSIIDELKNSGYNTVYIAEYPDNVSYEGYNKDNIVRVSYYEPLLSVVQTTNNKYEVDDKGSTGNVGVGNADTGNDYAGNDYVVPEGPDLIPEIRKQWPSYQSNGFNNPGGNVREVEHKGMSVVVTLDEVELEEYTNYIDVIMSRGYTYNVVVENYDTGNYYEAYDVNNRFIKINYVNNGVAVIEIGQLI